MSEHLIDLIRSRIADLRDARSGTERSRLRHIEHADECTKDIARYDAELNQLLADLERLTGPEDKIVMNP